MKTKLDYRKFKDYLIAEIDDTFEEECSSPFFNYQWIFKFENNYGASVVKHAFSYGFNKDLFELAVLEFDKDGYYSLTYKTPVANSVLGNLTNFEVMECLEMIKAISN